LSSGLWRVRDRASFVEIRTSARRSRSGPLRVSWVPALPGGPPRLALAVGRPVGTAVVRNRLRRRLRALVAEVSGELAPGTYLLAADVSATSLSHGELRTHLMTALHALPPFDPTDLTP
jgi:ribonuclease P protein component